MNGVHWNAVKLKYNLGPASDEIGQHSYCKSNKNIGRYNRSSYSTNEDGHRI